MPKEINRIEPLYGLIFTKVEVTNYNHLLTFYMENGRRFQFYHGQECCEMVYIEDICGDLGDLVGSPIVEATEVTHDDKDDDAAKYLPQVESVDYSWKWTFYRFSTVKGTVTVRWFGTSNGHYSERVDFRELAEKEVTEGDL